MKKITLLFSMILGVMLFASVSYAQQAEVTPFPNQSEVYNSGGTEAMWDLLTNFAVAMGGEQAIATDGVNYFTCKWSANAYVNRYSTAGVKLDSFTCGSVGAGIRDLAYDGQYFYGGKNAAALYKMDFTAHTLVQTINCSGVAGIRHCTYDPTANSGAGGFWLGGWADMFLVSKTGSTLSTVSGLSFTGMYGTAYDNFTPGGPYIWIFDQGAGQGTPQLLHQFSIPNLTLTGVSHDVSDIPGFADGIAGGLESNNGGLYPGKYVLMANLQQSPNIVGVYEITVTGINNEPNTVVTVYPNPAKDYIKVSSSIYPITNLTVTNQLGQVVYENTTGVIETRINTSDFQSGVYFVRVQTKDGVATHKVAVQ